MSETAAAGPIGLGVKLPFNTPAEFIARYRDNVTRGGIYLRAKKVLPPGTMVNLDLKLTTGERLLHGSAVVHFVSGQQGTGPSGIGLRFLDLDAPSQQFLGDMLSNHPGAFADAPPVPAGVGPVQYADRPADDTAVTRVMTVPSDLLGAAVPLPAPGRAPPPIPAPPPVASPGGGMGAPPTRTDSFFAANWAPPPVAAPSAPPLPVAAPFTSPPSIAAVHTATTPAGGIPIAARPPSASPANVDAALLDRLEEAAGDARTLLGIGPDATAEDALKAAEGIRESLGLDAPGDELTTRLRRILGKRLDTAVRELERGGASSGSDSRGVSAAKALIAGDVASAYADGVDSDDPAAKAFALAAAVSAAAETKSPDWAARARQLADGGAGLPFLGNRWALVAHAAHAAGDERAAASALEALAKEDPSHPFVATRSTAPAGGRRTVGLAVAALLLVVGLAGGFAGRSFLSGSLFGASAPAPAPVAEAPKAAEPVKAPVVEKKEEPAKAAAATEEELPSALTAEAPADKAEQEKAAAEKVAAEAAAAEKAAASKAAADKAAQDQALADKAAADKAAADKAAADKAAADKLAAEKAAADKAAVAAKATTAGAVQPAGAKAELSADEKAKLAAAEAVTLRKAEAALDNEEDCNPYLDPLAGIVASNASVPNMGKAMILRARCYDATDRTSLARKEYRKYLSWFPKGAYVDEAREANEQ